MYKEFLGYARAHKGSSILTPHNSFNLNITDVQCSTELEFGLTGVPYDNYFTPRTNPQTQVSLELIPA